ncbi:MAG: hypothetical protein PVF74_14485, partial [Anaerolineales bacterium]
TVTDYGESWDEQLRSRYASRSLAAYFGEAKGLRGDEKGAFYVMVAQIGSHALRQIRRDWLPIESWHFMHFLSFQTGLFFLYMLCLRLMKKWAALGAVLLFATQPLLWGHAFINPKDIPFLAFFLGSVALGLIMADQLKEEDGQYTEDFSTGSGRTVFSDEWYSINNTGRTLFIWLSIGFAGIIIGLIAAKNLILNLASKLVYQAYHAEPSSPLGVIFSRLAVNAETIPVDLYINKAVSLFPRVVWGFSSILLALGIIIFARLFPSTTSWIWTQHLKSFIKAIWSSITNKYILAAGVILGLCTSIRVLGPAAGLLVGLYFLINRGRRAFPAFVAYTIIALATAYITWPGLWESPIKHFVGSLTTSSDFLWEGKVMFGGIDYLVDELPLTYLPVLFSVQFTETALIMFAIGIIIATTKSVKHRISRSMVLILALWLFVPPIVAMIQQPTMYDNFRHFLFIVPPVFIFAGVGVQAAFDRFNSAPLSTAFLFLLLLPGLYWNVTLHPYQYIYYNSIVGGVRGAFRNYEMDYWATSYREASEYINSTAPPNSKVIVWGPDHIVAEYARQDLIITEYRKENRDQPDAADYAIISTRHNKDQSLFPQGEQLFSVGRGGAVFVVVKQLQHAQSPDP